MKGMLEGDYYYSIWQKTYKVVWEKDTSVRASQKNKTVQY